MRFKMPRWRKHDHVKAADLNSLSEAIERLSALVVDGSTGLQYEWTAAGYKLSFIPRPVFRFAVITTACPAYSGSTMGKGAGTLDVLSYVPTTGVCTRAATSPALSVPIYNGGLESIVVGRRVAVYEERPGRWHAITEYCA